MKLVILSLFRNSAGYPIRRYMRQVAELQELAEAYDLKIHLIAVHGDCTDDTKGQLMDGATSRNIAMTLVERSHGGPVFGSTEHPERLKALSYVINGGLEAVTEDVDAVFYVESDLHWEPRTVLSLLEHVQDDGNPMVAPLVFAGEHFYDIFVFRKNGVRFSPFHPYHKDLELNGLTSVDSVGSAFMMRGEVARHCRIHDDRALLGFSQNVWDQGFSVKVDARLQVVHP